MDNQKSFRPRNAKGGSSNRGFRNAGFIAGVFISSCAAGG